MQNIEEFISTCNDKAVLRRIVNLAKNKIDSTRNVGDKLVFKIDYMIGDGDGNTKESRTFNKVTQDQLDAITVLDHILTNHTEPNKGTWGFILDEENFSKKPEEVCNILYGEGEDFDEEDEDKIELPESYAGVKLTPEVVKEIRQTVQEIFSGETEYSFLVYEGHSITGK